MTRSLWLALLLGCAAHREPPARVVSYVCEPGQGAPCCVRFADAGVVQSDCGDWVLQR